MVGWIKINSLSFVVVSVLLLACLAVCSAQQFTVGPGWTFSSGDEPVLPTPEPSVSPTVEPTDEPQDTEPTATPTTNPTEQPNNTVNPTSSPEPTVNPSNSPDPSVTPITPEDRNIGILIILGCAVTFITIIAVLKWRETV